MGEATRPENESAVQGEQMSVLGGSRVTLLVQTIAGSPWPQQ